MSPRDLARVGASGLRTRPLRVILSALGIAIGIAAMLSVVGISTSSRAQLDRTLSRLGTNLLVVGPGKTLFGEDAELPVESVRMVDRIGPVERASGVGNLHTTIYRNDHIQRGKTNSIAVLAARPDLLSTVGATVAAGSWLVPGTPTVVLGSKTAQRLDIRRPGVRAWLGGRWFGVVGILAPVELARELDSSALVEWSAAVTYLRFREHPTAIYCRSVPDQVEAVRSVLAATASPGHPEEVTVSRPSDALDAQRATDATFTGLLLGLGAVALLVGGVGVANTMIISVLERRSEIGLRRSLGATRGHIRAQFLAESLLLSALGGGGGIVLGVLVTAVYAVLQKWPVTLPGWASGGGFAATLLIGMAAGLYPAARAARLSPTEALATT